MTAVEVAKRQRNQRGEGARLRDEVIEAAMRLLDRAPAEELSLRTVAREAGVTAPSIYRHFADANAMMSDVVAACWRQLSVAMSAASNQLADEEPLVRLQGQMTAYVRYAMQRPSRYQLLFAPAFDFGSRTEGPGRLASRAARELIELHAERGGRLPARDTLASTVLTISLVHGRIGLAHLAPARPGNAPSAVEEFISEVLQNLFT